MQLSKHLLKCCLFQSLGRAPKVCFLTDGPLSCRRQQRCSLQTDRSTVASTLKNEFFKTECRTYRDEDIPVRLSCSQDDTCHFHEQRRFCAVCFVDGWVRTSPYSDRNCYGMGRGGDNLTTLKHEGECSKRIFEMTLFSFNVTGLHTLLIVITVQFSIKMSVEQWWNDTDSGKLKYWEKNIIQRVW